MNHFFTLLFAASCLTAVGQTEYPYPYNPDGNNDGYIGLVDLLDLLTSYGQEFTPEELAFTDEAAIIDLGPMFFGRCIVECSKLEGDWKVSDIEGIGAFEEELVPNGYYWTESIQNGGVGGSSTYRLPVIQNTNFQTALVNESSDFFCACLTRAYPQLDYECLDVPHSEYESAAQELIDQGFLPVGGPTNHGGANKYFGCFWRWAE